MTNGGPRLDEDGALQIRFRCTPHFASPNLWMCGIEAACLCTSIKAFWHIHFPTVLASRARLLAGGGGASAAALEGRGGGERGCVRARRGREGSERWCERGEGEARRSAMWCDGGDEVRRRQGDDD